MSVPFLVIAPLALLAIVLLFCFAGCDFEFAPLEDFKEYSDVTVLAHCCCPLIPGQALWG